METEKKPTSEALKRAKKKYYEKMKSNEDFIKEIKKPLKNGKINIKMKNHIKK